MVGALVLGALLVAGLATDAFARGGGGGNFGGGGNGGGGGGGGGDGLGALIWVLVRIAIEYPLVGIPLLIAAAVFFVFSAKRGRRVYTGSVIRRGRVAGETNRAADAFSRILVKDPAFDDAAFLARVETAFVKVQQGWCAHDLTPIRPFVSDGIHERFSLQIEEQKALGYRDHMEGLQVSTLRLAQATFEGDFDVLTVLVRARARDYRVSIETGKRVGSAEVAESFAEYWTFMRRTGVATKAGAAGLMEGNCPNCGAGIDANQWAKCEHCGALLRSGEHDWVLVEITQHAEWEPKEPLQLPGVADLRARDPHVSLQQLEDKASVLFWRWQASLRSGDVKPLGRLASPGALDLVRAEIAELTEPSGRRMYPGECGVGRVETVGVVAAESASEVQSSSEGQGASGVGGAESVVVDRAVVEIRWQGSRFHVEPGGTPQRGKQMPVHWTYFLLDRARTATTDIDDSFSSAHCHSCGAPEAGGEGGTCQYCGEALNDVSTEWVLAEYGARYGEVGQRAAQMLAGAARRAAEAVSIREPAEPFEPVWAGVLAWMVEIAASDGEIDPKERAALERVASRGGVRTSVVEDMLQHALSTQRSGDGSAPGSDVPRPGSGEEARMWLSQAARVALSDGRLDRGEMQLLHHLGQPHGLYPADIRLIVNDARSQLFQEAKLELAESKRRRHR